jgi:hypothetical protein
MQTNIKKLMPQFDFIVENKLVDMPHLDLAKALNENGFTTLSGENHCGTSAKALLKIFYKEVEKTKSAIIKTIDFSGDFCATALPNAIKNGNGEFHIMLPCMDGINENPNIIEVPNCSSILYVSLYELKAINKVTYSTEENTDKRVFMHLQDSAPTLNLPVVTKPYFKSKKPCWVAAIYVIKQNQPTFYEIPCDNFFHN